MRRRGHDLGRAERCGRVVRIDPATGATISSCTRRAARRRRAHVRRARLDELFITTAARPGRTPATCHSGSGTAGQWQGLTLRNNNTLLGARRRRGRFELRLDERREQVQRALIAAATEHAAVLYRRAARRRPRWRAAHVDVTRVRNAPRPSSHPDRRPIAASARDVVAARLHESS